VSKALEEVGEQLPLGAVNGNVPPINGKAVLRNGDVGLNGEAINGEAVKIIGDGSHPSVVHQ
jgi:hypothetical protein